MVTRSMEERLFDASNNIHKEIEAMIRRVAFDEKVRKEGKYYEFVVADGAKVGLKTVRFTFKELKRFLCVAR